MFQNTTNYRVLRLGLLLAMGASGNAAVFSFTNNDLVIGFRKNAPYTEANEVVVDIGQASNYTRLAVGTTIPVPGFSAGQLSPGSFTTLNNLSWSVFGAYTGTTYPGYPTYTLWLTAPRADSSVRTADAVRLGFSSQQLVRGKMASIPGSGGAGYVSQNLGASNAFNTPTLVRESISAFGGHTASTWLASLVDATQATFNDTWPSDVQPSNGDVENTTPSSFTSAVRSDLYEVRPTATATGVPIVDPHTGLTSGPAWYVGYFQLNPNGTMTFTRENSSTTPPPPPPPALSIGRAGNVSTISFVSSNTATYTLLFTNYAGLSAPAANWSSAPGTIIGDGTTKAFQDTTTDLDRVYRVQGR